MSKLESLEDTTNKRWNTMEPAIGDAAPAQSWIDSAPGRAFLALSVFYLIAVLLLSSVKVLWLDELITLHIAKTGGPGAIWAALQRGADPNPPVTHLLVHFSRALFGDHEWAYRLPDFIGYWIGLASLFAYLWRRIPATWALAGTMLSMTMAAFDYSYESRSYGIFYGLAMLAFLCWTRAAHQAQSAAVRYAWIAGLLLALALGISTNYFAVLAFLPVSFGELARTLMRAPRHGGIARSIDWPVWIAIVSAGTPLLAYRPLIEHSIAQFAPYAWNKVSLGEVADSYTEMVEATLWLIIGVFLFAVLVVWARKAITTLCSESQQRLARSRVGALVAHAPLRIPVPLHEALGVVTLMLYPFLGYVIASIRGGMLSPRFVIPVCFGFAIAGVVVAYQVFGRMRNAGLIALCFLTAWFICRESLVGYWYKEQKDSLYSLIDRLPEALQQVPDGAPIAIPDPLLVLTLQHYAPADVARRIVFPVDFPAIREVRGDDSPEENLWAGRNSIYSIPIVPLAQFSKASDQYLIIADGGSWYFRVLNWHHYTYKALDINTRAESMGGFTPIAHGTPWFYTASWHHPRAHAIPYDQVIPFDTQYELPSSKSEDLIP